MPFADHVIAIAVRAQHFRQRTGAVRDLAALTGEAAIEIRQTTDTDGMVIATGHHRRPGCRTHRGGVKSGIAYPLRGQRVDRPGFNRRAITAEIREAHVIEKDHQ